LMEKYRNEEFFFELTAIDNGYQFLTKNKFSGTLSVLFQQNNKKKLSNAAMETLSIIAYQQPITKSGVEQIRGVNCDYSIQKLLEKDLITIAGKSDAPGRPILYATSRLFMDYFKLNTIEDLPRLKDIQPAGNEIGVQAEG
ncbi:MAG TPA: SMC-Scp complex subunit ScpB, partial [Anseongella sp.]